MTLFFFGSVYSQDKKPAISITHLDGDFYVFQTWIMFGSSPVACNGLYVVTGKGVVLINTPPDEEQTSKLIDSIEARHRQKVVLCVATHFHKDGTGGFALLRQKGIKTYSSFRTQQLCIEKKEHPSEFYFNGDTSFTVGNHVLQTFYPGEGHTSDNIVVWFDREKILAGGCLVKSTEAGDLGYLGDANTHQWAASIRNLIRHFPAPRYIIPGHQGWAGTGSLTHTLELLDQYKKKEGDARIAATDNLIFTDDFDHPLDTAIWVTEKGPQPEEQVYTKDGNLVLDTKGGVTVWLKKRLQGNIRIEYDRRIPFEGAPHDRLSDLNQFWMARDPRNRNLFTRSGVLESYDSLELYYVGMGGNSNKTTRFRKYEGNGERKLLQEYTDSSHLLQAGKTYHITTIIKNGVTEFLVDGVLYFTFTDPQPLREGYFGFRSTKSRQLIGGIKVYTIQ
jgi:rhamnogalacturonan endolyase